MAAGGRTKYGPHYLGQIDGDGILGIKLSIFSGCLRVAAGCRTSRLLVIQPDIKMKSRATEARGSRPYHSRRVRTQKCMGRLIQGGKQRHAQSIVCRAAVFRLDRIYGLTTPGEPAAALYARGPQGWRPPAEALEPSKRLFQVVPNLRKYFPILVHRGEPQAQRV